MKKGINLWSFWFVLLECPNSFEAIDIESNEVIENNEYERYDAIEVEIIEIEGKRIVRTYCKNNNMKFTEVYDASQIFEHIKFNNSTKFRTYDDMFRNSFVLEKLDSDGYTCVAIDVVGDEFELICLKK